MCIHFETSFEVVGKFFDILLEDETLQKSALPLRPKFVSQKKIKDFGGVLHLASGFLHCHIIQLMVSICKNLPEFYDVLYCTSHITGQDLQLFIQRCQKFGRKRQFFLLEVNKLRYELQEVSQ